MRKKFKISVLHVLLGILLLTGIFYSLDGKSKTFNTNLISLKTQLADTNITIKANKSIYKKDETVNLLISGYLWCTGECKSLPHFGVLKKKDITWDTLVNIKNSHQFQVDCGLATRNFKNEIVELTGNRIPFTQIKITSGIYRLSVISADRKRIVYSDQFRVE